MPIAPIAASFLAAAATAGVALATDDGAGTVPRCARTASASGVICPTTRCRPRPAPRARRVHAGRQRLDRLRPHARGQLAGAPRARARGASRDAVHARAAPAAPGGAGRPVRREPALDRARRRVRDPERRGSCNDLCDTAPDPDEWAARNAADVAWLKATFADAVSRGAAAVMLIFQADPGWNESDPTRAPLRDPKTLARGGEDLDGYQAFLSALHDEMIGFGKPVAAVHGDSHSFRHRQAAAGRERPPPAELHARRDVRRPPGERQQRRPVAAGGRRSGQSRRVLLPAAGHPRQRGELRPGRDP
jgi:hypothetical protein